MMGAAAKWQSVRDSFGKRVLLMGILNVTPDSFSDGGLFYDTKSAVEHGLDMVAEGADTLDVGGESSRPCSKPVSAEEEIARVTPVIAELSRKTRTPISIDTTKASVAREALKAGASILNDISGLRNDPEMARLAAESGAGLVLMHSRGTPETMRDLTEYDDLVGDVLKELSVSIEKAVAAGVRREQIVLDPGVGFAKTMEQNYEILARLPELRAFGFPLLVGPSRKSFIGKLLDRSVEERLWGTAAAVASCVLGGADLVRVHDVREMADVVRVSQTVRQARQ